MYYHWLSIDGPVKIVTIINQYQFANGWFDTSKLATPEIHIHGSARTCWSVAIGELPTTAPLVLEIPSSSSGVYQQLSSSRVGTGTKC